MKIIQALLLGLLSFIPIALGYHFVCIVIEYVIALPNQVMVWGIIGFAIAWAMLSVVAWLYLGDDT